MNYLMLRGQVPTDRNPKEIAFDNLETEDDMWTHLMYAMMRGDDSGEVWYWGGRRFAEYKFNFRVRWVKDYKHVPLPVVLDHQDGIRDFYPDVVFCRGGFPENHRLLKRLGDETLKIYYGAGKRFLPLPNYTKYDLILVDSAEQKEIAQKKFPKIPVKLFFKPAPENCFFPMKIGKREYDACYVAVHPADARKRAAWVYKTVPKDIRVLQLGSKVRLPYPKNVSVNRVERRNICKAMNRCYVGVVPYTEDDSGPRVVSEFLAAGIPVVALSSVRLWRKKFEGGVRFTSKKQFWDKVRSVAYASRHTPEVRYEARKWYDDNLSLKQAAKHLRHLIAEVAIEKEFRGDGNKGEDSPVLGSLRQTPLFTR